jgi:RimJ/RimL family protein N-acetyltransferase
MRDEMITIRRIRVGEGELFKQIRLDAVRESPAAFGSTYESMSRRTPESWTRQADSSAQGPDRATFLAFSGDKPVGIMALYRIEEGSDVGELLQVWVSPEYRSQALAAEITDAVFDWAGESGFRTVVAAVAKENARALRFYEKYGFRPTSEVSLDHAIDGVVLIKDVEVAN